MKAKSIIWIFFVTVSWIGTNGFSQNTGIPSGISYQAVARDANGYELTNRNIAVRISLIKGSSDDSVEWIESHSVTTDQFGLFNLIIGEGSRENGSLVDKFSDINWGTDPFFLKVEIDFGSGYRNLGKMPLLSVPYALYAATSGSSNGTDNQTLHFDSLSHKLSLDRGGFVDLSPLVTTGYVTALITKIELKGNILSINQADQVQSIDLSRFNQQISYDSINNRLILSDGGSVNLSGFVKNSETNRFYISNMLLSGDSLVIYQGGIRKTIDLSHFNSPSNTWQHLSLSNNILKLSQDSTSIDLSKYLQNLTLIEDSLKLSNVNGGVDLAKYNKYLSLVSNHLFLSDNPNSTPVDLSQYQDNYYLERDNTLNSYALKDSKGQTKGEIYLAPYIQDLRTANDRLWITGNKDSTIVDLRKYIQQITLDKDSNKLYVTNGNGVTSFTINQSLSLNDSILSLTKDPTHTKINLNAFDNQWLHVSTNKLTIDNGNSVYIDTDTTNELQSLVLKNDTLSLTKDPSLTKTKIPLVSYDRQKLHLTSTNQLSIDRGDTIDLSKYDKQLSFSNGQLSLTNGGSVNVRENLYAFRALNTNNKRTLAGNDSIIPNRYMPVFPTPILNIGNLYDENTGIISIPNDGEGLYQFNVSYTYPTVNHILRLIKNGLITETLQNYTNYNYSFILYLYSGDKIYIRLVNTDALSSYIGIGSFFGYRINQ
jgi:hypothetical protein